MQALILKRARNLTAPPPPKKKDQKKKKRKANKITSNRQRNRITTKQEQ